MGFFKAATGATFGQSIITGGGQTAFSAAASYAGARKQNKENREESQRNRDFQKDQSGNAHQREVADLRAAGLNPILSGVGGSGAATSAGSMATMVDQYTPTVNSALESRRNYADVKRTEQETQTSFHTAQNQSAQAGLNEKLGTKANHDSFTAKSLRRIADNEQYSSDIERKLDELSAEKIRRATDRYGGTAKELFNFNRTPDYKSRHKKK